MVVCKCVSGGSKWLGSSHDLSPNFRSNIPNPHPLPLEHEHTQSAPLCLTLSLYGGHDEPEGISGPIHGPIPAVASCSTNVTSAAHSVVTVTIASEEIRHRFTNLRTVIVFGGGGGGGGGGEGGEN